MKLYIGDELAMASAMTNAEFGSYMFLKMHYWQYGRLPVDDARLARIARVTAQEWQEIKPTIEVLFDDEWGSSRMDELRAEAEERHRKLSEAGKKGGRPRKEEKPGNKPGFSYEKAWPKQPEPEPEPDPYSVSDPVSGSGPEGPAFENGKMDTDTREGSTVPFPRPANISQGRAFLRTRDIPQAHFERCLRMLMDGHLSPYDIEGLNGEGEEAA